MDYLKRIQDNCNKQAAILDKAKAEGRAFTAEEKKAFDDLQADIENCKAMIDAQKAHDATTEALTAPATDQHRIDVVDAGGPVKIYKTLSEQLIDIKNATTGKGVSDKMQKFMNATGMSAGTGTDGGFGLQQDFAGLMLDTAVEEDAFLSMLDSYEITAGKDRLGWVDAEESSVATTVFGGVTAYWAAEAATVTATKPALKEKELKLQKLMALVYSTYELDTNSGFSDSLITRACETAIRRALASAVVAGDGVGKPVGFGSAPGLVSQAKETNQAAATIVWENLSKMFHRRLKPNEGKWAWVMHPDCHQQLDFLSFPVGTGGVPVYLPATQEGKLSTLRGLPIVESDFCSALGTVGDIYLVDLQDYLLIYKGGIDKAVSIHVQFLYAENAFRFILQVNGMPKRSTALTIKNSSTTRSKIIALATRS